MMEEEKEDWYLDIKDIIPILGWSFFFVVNSRVPDLIKETIMKDLCQKIYIKE